MKQNIAIFRHVIAARTVAAALASVGFIGGAMAQATDWYTAPIGLFKTDGLVMLGVLAAAVLGVSVAFALLNRAKGAAK